MLLFLSGSERQGFRPGALRRRRWPVCAEVSELGWRPSVPGTQTSRRLWVAGAGVSQRGRMRPALQVLEKLQRCSNRIQLPPKEKLSLPGCRTTVGVMFTETTSGGKGAREQVPPAASQFPSSAPYWQSLKSKNQVSASQPQHHRTQDGFAAKRQQLSD